MSRIVLIDGFNLIYRAFHGSPKFTSADGSPTGGIYMTLKMLKSIRKKLDLDFGLVVMDSKKATFRDALDENYKANRKPMPDDLKLQMGSIQEGMGILGWPQITADGVEADDVIGSIASYAAQRGHEVFIVSSDKDFRQLVDDQIKIVDTMNDIIYDRQMVFDKMGIYPENVRAYLSLLGDSSDNVKGVDKVGEKTAVKLLTQYGSLEGVKENAAEIAGVVGVNIREAIANGNLDKSFELVTLKLDCMGTLGKKDFIVKDLDLDRYRDFCEKHNLQAFLKELNSQSKPSL